MVQFHSRLHSTFKEISNDTSHAQIEVKMKKLWYRQIGEENKLYNRKCGNKVKDKLYLYKPKKCRDKAEDKAKDKICLDKPKKCLNKAKAKTLSRQSLILSRQIQRQTLSRQSLVLS